MGNRKIIHGVTFEGKPITDEIMSGIETVSHDYEAVKHYRSETNGVSKKPLKKIVLRAYPLDKRIKSVDTKPGKVKFLDKGQIRKEYHMSDIKSIKINIDVTSLTTLKAIFLGFRANDYVSMIASDISVASGKSARQIYGPMSVAVKAEIVSVTDDAVKRGRSYGIREKYREDFPAFEAAYHEFIRERQRSKNSKAKKTSKKVASGGGKSIESGVNVADLNLTNLSNRVKHLIVRLNAATKAAASAGLTVRIDSVDSDVGTLPIFKEFSVNVYKEF